MTISNTDSATLSKIADSMGVSFSLNGILLTNEEAFAPDGGLPLFYLAAQDICGELNNMPIGVEFEYGTQDLFGVGATVSDSAQSVRLLVCTDALVEFIDSELMKAENNGRVIDLSVLHARLIRENPNMARMEF